MDKYLSSNGIRLCYQQMGDSSNEPVVLIAGLGEQLGEWPDGFCELLSKNYRVIRYDNRDIGLSDNMTGQHYSLNDMANDALGLLDALEIKQAHVVGMSMGGMIAQILSAECPERIASLCLIMSTSGKPGLPGPTPAVQEIMTKKTDGTVDGFIENWVEGKRRIDSPSYPTKESTLRDKAMSNCERSYNPGGYMRHLMAIAENGSRVNYLEKIRCPSLVLHGTEDPLIPKQCAQDLVKHIQDSKLELIEGMGHNLPPELHARLCNSIIANIELASR